MDARRTLAVALVVALVVGATPALATLATTGTPIEGETPISADGAPTIVLASPGGTTDVDLQNHTLGPGLNITTTTGNMTVTGDDAASARLHVDGIEGTQTQLTAIDAGSAWLQLDPADKQRVDVRGDAETLSFQSIAVDDGNTDLQLGGPQGGTAEVRLWGLTAGTTYGLYDSSRDEYLGAGTANASGVLQTDVDLPDGTHSLEVRTATEPGPTVSNLTPNGTVTSAPDTLSADVAAQAWPVNVSFYLEGSYMGSDILRSNGTASTSVNVDSLGTYDWSANATDGLLQHDNQTATFETPRNLTLREEHAPQQLIDTATVTARFFSADGDIAIERSTSDGRINMSGLPDSEFILFIESPTHYDRQVFLPSIFDQENIYLLNETEFPRANNSAIRSRFLYEDLTGKFPTKDTTIQIQRAIDLNADNESEFRTVAGAFWGASNEFAATLEFGERYRIVLVNQETGERTIQGAHVPREDLTQTIRVTGLVERAQNASGVVALADLNASAQTLDLVYRDPADDTDTLAIRVVSRSGGTELYNTTVSGPLGTYTDSISLNSSQAGQSWIVEYRANGGDRHRAALPVGDAGIPLPLAVPGWLLTLLMSMAVTFVAGLYGPRTALLGAWAMVFVAGGAMLFGWAFSVPSVVVAALVAAGATFVSRALP